MPNIDFFLNSASYKLHNIHYATNIDVSKQVMLLW